MSFWKKLFGGASVQPPIPPSTPATPAEKPIGEASPRCDKCGRTLETIRREFMRSSESLHSSLPGAIIFVEGDDRLHHCKSCKKSFCFRCLKRGVQCSECPECGADIWDPFGETL